LCPTNLLVNQWEEEVKKYRKVFGLSLPLTSSQKTWRKRIGLKLRGDHTTIQIIISTYANFIGRDDSDYFYKLIINASVNNAKALLIADEVHWAGAKTCKSALSNEAIKSYFLWRLGLSATYEREGDEGGTNFIKGYFGNSNKPETEGIGNPIVGYYDLQKGLDEGVLCPFYYYPIIRYLDEEKSKDYWKLIRTEISDEFRNTYRNASLGALTEILNNDEFFKDNELPWTMVFAPIGKDPELDDKNFFELTVSQINALNRGIRITHLYGNDESVEERIDRFKKRELDFLVGQKIFDEGVSIPEVRNAIMMYSFDRVRQFVQRRGRVLRTSKNTGKKYAKIFDVIVLPQRSNLSEMQQEEILRRETRRYEDFCKYAMNGNEAKKVIDNAIEGLK
jgi:superfamily II DNA or RNA helicase